jgi:hypothetical protein
MNPSTMIGICLVTFSVLFPKVSLGCSLALDPISEFDSSQYVFIGEVLGIVGPFRSAASKAHGELRGIRVNLKDPVYLPRSPAVYFEVFPYKLTPWCGLEGWKNEELLRFYPTGSQIRVIAKESTLLESSVPGGNVRLEASIYNRGSIARDFPEKSLFTSTDSTYDYGKYNERKRTSADEEPLFYSNSHLPDFELRKDLLRLRNAKTEKQRVQVLERIVNYPRTYQLDFLKVIQIYLRDKKLTEYFKEEWNRRQ